ncbi:MAG: FMN-binding protein [Vicinamibacterales bacterium]
MAALAAVVAGAGLALHAGQRPADAARPEAHLRALFPDAAAFSAKEGDPPAFKVFAVDPAKDPAAKPVGYAFWTVDVLPDARGYEGPIHLFVGMDAASRLTGVIVDSHTEPYGYFALEPPSFTAQFKGKSIRDRFEVGADIAAVSRASLSVARAAAAVRDSARRVERTYLSPARPR